MISLAVFASTGELPSEYELSCTYDCQIILIWVRCRCNDRCHCLEELSSPSSTQHPILTLSSHQLDIQWRAVFGALQGGPSRWIVSEEANNSPGALICLVGATFNVQLKILPMILVGRIFTGWAVGLSFHGCFRCTTPSARILRFEDLSLALAANDWYWIYRVRFSCS